MALVSITASTPAAVPQVQAWSEELWREARVKSAWNNFMGASNMPIIKLDKFEKEKGDAINYVVFPETSGRGIAGSSGTALEGNEASVTPVADTVKLDQLRIAMGITGRLDEQRFAGNMRMAIKENLAYQYSRLIDLWIFRKLSGVTMTDTPGNTYGEAATANSSVLYPNGKTASAGLVAGDTFSPDLLSKAKEIAMEGVVPGGATASWKIKPMIINGLPYYGCWIHPRQAYDLKRNSEWRENQLHAGVRGVDNPIFNGSIGILDNVIVYTHDLVITGTDAGDGTVAYGDALFFGLEAGVMIQGQSSPDWIEKTFDYGNSWRIASQMLLGFDKTTFTHPTPSAARDFGVIRIRTAASTPV